MFRENPLAASQKMQGSPTSFAALREQPLQRCRRRLRQRRVAREAQVFDLRAQRLEVFPAVHVAPGAQEMAIGPQAGDDFQRAFEDFPRAPGYVLKELPERALEADEVVAEVVARPQHDVARFEVLERLLDEPARQAGAVGADDDHPPASGGEGLWPER